MPQLKKPSKIRAFKTSAPMQVSQPRIITDEHDRVIDYLDVSYSGYASTFAHVTKADLYGDNILPSAFERDLPDFMKNPVALIDHYNSVGNIGGVSKVAYEDERGLYVAGKLSNSPSEKNIDLRFKLVEGMLKGISIGGLFYYMEDKVTIYRVKLLEYSFVAIPANPDALLDMRKLSLREVAELIRTSTATDELENLASLIESGDAVEERIKARAMKMLIPHIVKPGEVEKEKPQSRGFRIGNSIKITGSK
jgi:HK97 family phage prohead protease